MVQSQVKHLKFSSQREIYNNADIYWTKAGTQLSLHTCAKI